MKPAAGLAVVVAAASIAPVRAAPIDWNALAQCESGGNWSANTGNGHYGGLQISEATWLANGGLGSPATSPPQEQIRVANNIMATQGPAAWPKCATSTGAVVPGSITYILTHLQGAAGRPCVNPLKCF
ncbi:transglycosylase family protein [Mycobacterium sp. HUMS_1102779]|uniref:transglycosylase family protein n=1 Tax=Mycobacterium sp. HUMS_1102779 TaxID=3383487 RepID=UPI00389AC5CA